MTNYRTMGEVEEEYLRNHHKEIDDYITVLFDEYAESGDTASLMSSLCVFGRVKGVTHIAEASGLSRKGVQKSPFGKRQSSIWQRERDSARYGLPSHAAKTTGDAKRATLSSDWNE
jgi:DNA-binding phage protein